MKSLWSIFARFGVAAILAAGLALPAAAQGMEPPDFSITPQERAAVIEGSIRRLNEIYIFPETAKKMESALRARAAKREYDSITSARELARKLTADLREVSRDKHLGVMYFPEGARDEAPGGPSDEERKAQRAYVEKVNFGFEKAERMPGNIGYVEIRGFVPPDLGGQTASAAMGFVAHADALILDLRRNGGGAPAMIAYVLSYLFDQPTHLNDIYERVGEKTQQWWTMPYVPGARFGGKKPVYVLTSRDTFSGGEEFAYNLKNLKRATLIGETTGGGAHPVRGVRVSEHFAIGVPFARAINPITGTNWEGTGVVPDIARPAGEALDAAYALALEKLIETAENPDWKAQLQDLLKNKKPASPGQG